MCISGWLIYQGAFINEIIVRMHGSLCNLLGQIFLVIYSVDDQTFLEEIQCISHHHRTCVLCGTVLITCRNSNKQMMHA